MDDKKGKQGGLVNLRIHGKISVEQTVSKIDKCQFSSVNAYDYIIW